MILNLSEGGSSSSFALSIVIPLKLSSSSGRFRDSHAGVRRTGSVESFRPAKKINFLINDHAIIAFSAFICILNCSIKNVYYYLAAQSLE
jgi:hypothetical protein